MLQQALNSWSQMIPKHRYGKFVDVMGFQSSRSE
jgi:hypothetical protein